MTLALGTQFIFAIGIVAIICAVIGILTFMMWALRHCVFRIEGGRESLYQP